MLTAIRLRLYPTPAQEIALARQFGCARWVWNDALAETQRLYRETGKGLAYESLTARLPVLKAERDWLGESVAQALQQSLRNLARAFQNFFERRGRYPRFKSKQGRQSVQFPQGVRVLETAVVLPKLGTIRAKVHCAVVGAVKTVTVTRETDGRFFASVLTDDGLSTPVAAMPPGGRFTGVDLGLTDFAVTSKGQHFPNPRHLAKKEKNLKRKQRNLSRKKKGSASRAKARRLVARCHSRIADARKDFLHKLSRKLVSENQALAFESLNVRGMLRNHSLAKAIGEAGWGMFTSFCRYKNEREGKLTAFVDRFFPSSKTCSCCGRVRAELPLSVRMWTCEICGTVHDRDENAGSNIGQEADRMLLAGLITAPGTGAAAVRGTVSRRRGRRPSTVQVP